MKHQARALRVLAFFICAPVCVPNVHQGQIPGLFIMKIKPCRCFAGLTACNAPDLAGIVLVIRPRARRHVAASRFACFARFLGVRVVGISALENGSLLFANSVNGNEPSVRLRRFGRGIATGYRSGSILRRGVRGRLAGGLKSREMGKRRSARRRKTREVGKAGSARRREKRDVGKPGYGETP